MTKPTFDHERRDIYRLSIEYVAFSYRIAKSLGGSNRQARDQWLRAAQSVPLNIAEGNGKQSLEDKNRFFEIARGSALECAAIHDVLRACNAIDDDWNGCGKTDLKRNVAMLTRQIQRTHGVSEDRIDYEYEYRDAEYEYGEPPKADEHSDATERKRRSDSLAISRSLAAFPPADRQCCKRRTQQTDR